MLRFSLILMWPCLALVAGCSGASTTMDIPHIQPSLTGEEPMLITPNGMDVEAVVKLTNATTFHYAHPHVSYDGKWLVYVSNHARGKPDVYVQPLGGFAARQLTSGSSSNITPAIAPDSKAVAFASDRDGKHRIYITSIDGASALEEVSDPSWEAISPTWAPDGMRLAYATRRDATSPWMIALRDRSNGQTTYLTQGSFPDWSPYGDHIVFQRNSMREPGYTSIYTIRSDGSELTRVYHADDHGAVTPSWAGGGEWILFATVNKSRNSRTRTSGEEFRADDVWMVRRDGTQARMLTQHRLADWDPCYDPQGQRVVYVSNREGAQNIYAMKVNLRGPALSYHGLFGGAGGR